MDSTDTSRGHSNENDLAQKHESHHHDHEKQMTPDEVVNSLLVLGQVALDAGDYESAAEAYASALQLKPNEVASYNLGSLRARGLGVTRDFAEAARLFHQAELMGNERAGMLCAKCMFDYVHDGIEGKTPADVYATMAVFVSRVYPEAIDQRLEVSNGLAAVANTLLSKGECDEASKVLSAADEFGNRV